MNIFEFLLANPLFLFIAIGILFSLFKRPKPEAGEEQNQKPRTASGQQRQQRPTGQNGQGQPTQAGPVKTQQREIKDWRDLFFEPEPEVQSEEPRQPTKIERYPTLDEELVVDDRKTDMEKEKDRRREQLKNVNNAVSELSRAQEEAAKRFEQQTEQVSNKRSTTSNDLGLHLNQLSGKEAMRAVVMAEVLGPPRARNPRQAFARSNQEQASQRKY
ncbi:hypothetical protein [Alkalihalobacillus pseudalcaliphilus]|uniref:hypothetical protein n=1 Tax=Alkalihalobacillus pseudalcaliphilus TaxID=79884 RepID=UPI00064DBF7A|nr:hypothetical protein [Alkalihalobacillus pseudalcaliphilus]KMK75952.1 hypothetical protein AB990_11925 [Alkalihalobacillus pseudalcaliphilus]